MNPFERFLGAVGAAVVGIGGTNVPPERPARPVAGIGATMLTPPLPARNPLRVVVAIVAVAQATPAARPAAGDRDGVIAGTPVPTARPAAARAGEVVAVLPERLAVAPQAGVLDPPIADVAQGHAPAAGVILPGADATLAEGRADAAALAQRFADAMPAYAAYQAFLPSAGPTPAMAAFAALETPARAMAAAAPIALPAVLAVPAAGAAQIAVAPVPRARPAVPVTTRAAAERTDVALADFTGRRPAAGRPSDTACLTALASLGVTAEMLPPIRANACGVAAPVLLTSVRGATAVDMTPSATVNCQVAAAVDRWMESAVQPAAQRYLGGRITGVRVAAAYACRGRNNDPRADLSEHAFGNAIDISAFRTEKGEWVEVEPAAAAGPMAGRFLDEVRAAACGPFTTVLGPGVPLHNDHFHLDLARRGRTGESSYCR